MAKYLIEGGHKLNGTIKISGNKNTILPCLAATLLTQDEVTLENVPNIADVEVFLEILQSLGASVSRNLDQVTIKVARINSHVIPEELSSKLRASILMVGPLLSRVGKANFYHPGGDVIGKRSIQTHLDGFNALGFRVKETDRQYIAEGKIHQTEVEIFMEEASCTAAENLILASCLAEGKTVLKNCPIEPQILDLCQMLSQMGVKFEGVGTSTLTIVGAKNLSGTTFRVRSDYIEMTTYAIAAAITGGRIKIDNCDLLGLDSIFYPLAKMGLSWKIEGNTITFWADQIFPIAKLHTNIWPGFPTDLMSVFIVLATQTRGVSLMHDWMYESRMFFVDKLISMGAEIVIADPHRVLVHGPAKLYGREVETPDIRAGMALVLAALKASGKSTINKAELIERGYEDIVGKLTSLGAEIKRVD